MKKEAKKLDNFKIVFQKNDPVIFVPGESILGSLEFRVVESFKIESVFLCFVGYSEVRWAVGSIQNRRVYKSKEKYFKLKILIMDKCEHGNDAFYIQPGDYYFPFHIVLPQNLATSFEHENAAVRYMAVAGIEIPRSSSKLSFKVFSVLNSLDLNYVSGADISSMISKFYHTLCGSGVTCELLTQKSGFVPGERIQCIASISNQTKRTLKKIKLSLVQIINVMGERFRVHYKTYRQQVVSTTISNMILPESNEDLDPIVLIVPAVCPTSIESPCKIIDVSYELVFNFSIGFPYSEKEISIPLVIGTEPLNNRRVQFNQIQRRISCTQCTFQPSVFGPIDDPPEYDNAVGEVHESNIKSFTPYYPFYDYLTSQV